MPKCAEQYKSLIRTGIFYKAGRNPNSINKAQPINKTNIKIFNSSFQSSGATSNLFTPSFGAASSMSPHMGLSLTGSSSQGPAGVPTGAQVAHHLQSASPPPAIENSNNPAPPNCSTPTSTLQNSSIPAQQRKFYN